jgi:phosphoribulokinase
MSEKHPIISVTGSSGAGTTSVKKTFEQIFRREDIKAAFIEGDAFHRYDRVKMRQVMENEGRKGNAHFSHFGPDANLLEDLEEAFRSYGETGTGRTRVYIHDAADAEEYGYEPGTFTPWRDLDPTSDLLFYEGLHGAVVTETVNVARHADFKIGVVPVINLEWIQKIHRDKASRGYSTEAVMNTILRRMPDYVHYIVPQFAMTDVNFQRVPTVDTSNPFIARWIPTPDESMVVIRFKNPRGIDFAYLKTMIHDSFMSRANSIVIPGGKLDLAMQLILTPIISRLVEGKRRLSRASLTGVIRDVAAENIPAKSAAE